MRILSCNIRYLGADDGPNAWPYRRSICIDIIRRQRPDIICFQEMWQGHQRDIDAALPEFMHYGIVDEPLGTHPMNAIYYRSERFDRLSAGGYWLSESPHVPGSKSWRSACIRLANWVRLGDRETGAEFRIVNTHLDHISQEARTNQARMLVEEACAYPATYPQVLAGDLNSDHRSAVIACLKEAGWCDTFESVHGAGYPGFTAHDFLGPEYRTDIGKIDWIFMRGAIAADAAAVITDAVDGRYPSDHYFLATTLRLGRPG